MKNSKHKALRKIVEFYRPLDKEAYRRFCQYIGGRSEQGMFRAMISYCVSQPQIMNEILMQYDSLAIEENTANI